MSSDFETCRANLERLVGVAGNSRNDRNEATTRLQLIDTLFFDCLGWLKDDVVLEDSQGGEYADYTFIFPRRLLIVEAKREGSYFELPVGSHRLEHSLQSLLRTTPQLRSAIEQVTNYCQGRGVPYAAVSNGHQLVTFIASRSDGIPPSQGKAIVFESLEQMLREFLDLWNLLSKPAVEKQTLASKLTGQHRPVLPPKLSSAIKPYPGTKGRNPFQTSMKSLSEFILEDLPKAKSLEQTFLKACYCPSGALSNYSLLSKRILQARYSMLFDEERPGPLTTPITDGDDLNPELLAQSFSRRPILLIGDVGVGKTTFIRYLMNTESIGLRDKAITVYIDLGSKGTLSGDLRTYIVEEIERQLREDHGVDIMEADFVNALYSLEVDRFNRGIHKPLREKKPAIFEQKKIEYLESLLANRHQHLRYSLGKVSRSLRKQIVIFLDNTDQRSEQDQQAAFLIAQEMADQWDAMIYVTIRPETYHASIQRGALTGYHPKAFTVAPPRVDRVIQKRLLFGLKVARGKLPMDAFLQAATGDLVSLQVLLEVFLRSLRKREELLKCVENMSAGNVRLALELVRGFFGSGHVDTQKVINVVRDEGGYIVPIHEFQRAIIYGDSTHYDPDRSPIANLFDISGLDPREHFLQPLLLEFLRKPNASRSPDGFIDTPLTYAYLQQLRYTPEQIDVGLIRLFNKRLLETSARRIPGPGIGDSYAIRLTSAGLYHLDDFLPTFTYYDAVVVDTPIISKQHREKIRDAHSLEERLERGLAFTEYLDNCWKEVNDESAFDWPAKFHSARQLMERLYAREIAQKRLNLYPHAGLKLADS